MPASIEIYAKPDKLWRYRRLRPEIGNAGATRNRFVDEIRAIADNYIWCSLYKEMNDPMEGIYGRTTDRRVSEAVESMQGETSNLAIASFSENWDNELMWAHYADGFRGVCVAYEVKPLLDSLHGTCAFSRLAYADRPQRARMGENIDLGTRARTVLSTKSARWAYEREWRLFAPKFGGVPHGPEVVTKILFGPRISDDYVKEIRSELGQRENIRFYSTYISGYKVYRRELNWRTSARRRRASSQPPS